VIELRPFDVLVPAEGRIDIVPIQIPCYWDQETGEWFLTEEAHQLIEQTKIAHGVPPPRHG
jgi:hypothetical protein